MGPAGHSHCSYGMWLDIYYRVRECDQARHVPADAVRNLELSPGPPTAALNFNHVELAGNMHVYIICRSGRQWVLLGSGSNSLFPDPVFNGTVIINRMKDCRVVDASTWTDGIASSVLGNARRRPGHAATKSTPVKQHAVTTLSLGSGYGLAQLAMETTNKGWAGLEEFCGIPGTLGGALMCNAGSHGRVGPLNI